MSTLMSKTAPNRHYRLLYEGDLGKIDDDGCACLVERLTDIYELQNGKHTCPIPTEEAMSMSHFTSQVVLCSINPECNVALIISDLNHMQSHLSLSNNNDDISEEDIIN